VSKREISFDRGTTCLKSGYLRRQREMLGNVVIRRGEEKGTEMEDANTLV